MLQMPPRLLPRLLPASFLGAALRLQPHRCCAFPLRLALRRFFLQECVGAVAICILQHAVPEPIQPLRKDRTEHAYMDLEQHRMSSQAASRNCLRLHTLIAPHAVAPSAPECRRPRWACHI